MSKSIVRAWVLILCAAALGCAGSSNGDVLDLTAKSLEGTWEYLITNAYEAVFTGCSGDALVLEGLTFAEAMSEAPICVPSNTLTVHEDGGDLSVLEHSVTCSDNSSATVSGTGDIEGSGVVGQWVSSSDSGVTAVQTFSGEVNGDNLDLSETNRSFEGSFSGACALSPPLAATVQII